MPRPRIAAVVDDLDWAYAHAAHALRLHLRDRYDVRLCLEGHFSAGPWDAAIVFGWVRAPRVKQWFRPRKLLVCVRSDRARRHPAEFAAAAALADRVVAVNEPLGDFARAHHPGVAVCENGVDLDLFQPTPPPATCSAGWCGNSGRMGRDPKGVTLITAACAASGVPMARIDLTKNRRPHAQMPAFYQGIGVYVCASEAEGTPNPVLEAMAAGRPVITTDVGVVRKLVRDGVNGLVVPRTAAALAAALRTVAALPPTERARWGMAARAAVEPYSWAAMAARWRAVLDATLG